MMCARPALWRGTGAVVRDVEGRAADGRASEERRDIRCLDIEAVSSDRDNTNRHAGNNIADSRDSLLGRVKIARLTKGKCATGRGFDAYSHFFHLKK
jgi:hypothetical protein